MRNIFWGFDGNPITSKLEFQQKLQQYIKNKNNEYLDLDNSMAL